MRYAASIMALAIFLAGSPAHPQIGAPVEDAFTIDHAIDMVHVGSVHLSPDGRQLLYTVTELDWDDNERDSRLWIADFDGDDARPFTAKEGDGSARWSPDGRWIAFTRSADEDADDAGDGRQIWLIRTDGGEARQLTKHPTSVRSYEWAPDSRRLIFVANDTLPKEEKDAREEGYDAIFVNEGPNGQTRGSYSNIWWVPVDFDDRDACPITTGDRLIGDFAIHPDGERVAFTFRTQNHRNDGHLSEIALVDVAGGEIRMLTDNLAPESSLQWHPDGRLLFRAPDLERWELDQGNLYLMGTATGDITQLMAESTLDIRSGEFTPDGRYYDFTALDRTVTNFYRLDLNNREVRRMSDWVGGIGSTSWSRSHDRVAFTFDSPEASTAMLSSWPLRATPSSSPTSAAPPATAMTYTHADKVTTPTILFHGENDTVDTPGQSMNFHVALRHFDVPTRFILFPREGHGISEPRHHRTRLVEELRWLELYVRGNDRWEPPAREADDSPDGEEEGAG